mmetsp:Transcript_25518/g.35080  ORF Transcript_25518/g.35080 Transcript_25518/m.35080 type:complete len:203 (-) Transcript_25518:338-946(-)
MDSYRSTQTKESPGTALDPTLLVIMPPPGHPRPPPTTHPSDSEAFSLPHIRHCNQFACGEYHLPRDVTRSISSGHYYLPRDIIRSTSDVITAVEFCALAIICSNTCGRRFRGCCTPLEVQGRQATSPIRFQISPAESPLVCDPGPQLNSCICLVVLGNPAVPFSKVISPERLVVFLPSHVEGVGRLPIKVERVELLPPRRIQ